MAHDGATPASAFAAEDAEGAERAYGARGLATRVAERPFREVEPVLRTLTTPVHRSPTARGSAALGGAAGRHQVSLGIAIVLALIITLTVLVAALLVRRSRGCSGLCGLCGGRCGGLCRAPGKPREAFAPCCGA
jgi:hypothetical protein